MELRPLAAAGVPAGASPGFFLATECAQGGKMILQLPVSENITAAHLAQEDEFGRVIKKSSIVKRDVAFQKEDKAQDIVPYHFEATVK